VTEFDFLSVLVSIIFGLALTHLLSGQFRFVYQRRMTETHLLYTGWVFMVLVLNWWMLFTWHDYKPWTFDTFLLIVLWAMSFYVLSIALYPPEEIAPDGEPFNYFWFFCAVLGTLAADTAWTAMRGKLFTPWYYLPFVLHYAVLAILAARIKSRMFRRLVAWWFLLSVVAWSLGVRRFL
jgi:hypothetical protein